MSDKGEPKCHKCACLLELYERTPKSERDYWVMTELFVELHDGDTCGMGKPAREGEVREDG